MKIDIPDAVFWFSMGFTAAIVSGFIIEYPNVILMGLFG